MGHGHITRRLRLAILVTGLVLAGELVGGFLANSLALLSDAGHVFTHIFALVLSWLGARQAERPASARMTFGYHRVDILAGLINALALVVVAVVILYEAGHRLLAPPPVQSLFMLVVAVLGLGGNLVVLLLLRGERRSLSLRSAFLHVLGDTFSSVAVIAGGVVMYLTAWFWADPVASVVIGLVITFGAWRILKEGVAIFLEASPGHLDMGELVKAMKEVPGVSNIHDLHVWSIAPRLHALSCHVVISDSLVSQRLGILHRLNGLLKERFDIGHTTMQFECLGCDPEELYCNLIPEAEAHAPPPLEDQRLR